MSEQQFAMLLVESSIDVMVVSHTFCSYCFEQKTGERIIEEYIINRDEYKQLLKNGLSRGKRVKCECFL